MANKQKQMLAVWGSPGGGKTVTAVKLALELSKRKKNVVLVFTDVTAPTLPAVVSEKKLPDVSVGELLAAPGMTQEQVLKTCVPCEKNPYISFLGYKAGENVFTHAEYSKEKAVDMLVLLRHIADYVIVDCTSLLTGNVLATTALEVADDVLRVCSCDLKAISYFSSYLSLVADRKFKPEQHIKVLSNTRPYQGGSEYENSFGGVKYRLPYLPSLEEQAATLKLLEPLSGKEAKTYEPVIAAIHDLGQPAKAAFGKRYAAPSAGAYRWWRCKTGYWKGGNCVIVLILLAFVGMLTGIFLILGMTPFTFAEELTKPLSGRRQPISKQIQQVNHPKEPKGIRKTVLEAREMLILTGKGGKFAAICAFSLFLAAMGAVICIVIQNYFMLPVLAAGMGLLPFWYVLFTSHSYKKLMNNEIETGLSIITSSYLRSESMITAVEENIHYLNPPVADVFRGFLAETNMISADVKQALSNMKPKLDNYVFREWVDAAIACQDDKSLKSTLTPIIGKLSDMRIVAAELDYLLYEPFKEFITMAFLLIGNIPLLYFLNKDWYDVLVNTGFGKGILAVCLLVLLISFAAVIRLTKPVEYKR